MLDSVTKKRIDDLRNILVGKTPSPESQVEQITTGLIYKFMHDIDREAVEMGGSPSFFTGEYEKYAWTNLFDPKLGGADRTDLYSEAIEKMYTNPSAPPMFREIFKNAYLPFKDPSTLNMFLRGINEFDYSHSEKLGDAFEYLLSKMDSQGDAGQFRTPRHIIDFIVEIVNPQKNERILDPACGTAGFLISSYKHIQKQNTRKKLGDGLSAAERKRIGESIVGYDISPDMTRISLVNMYLHQFATPQIHEYDILSSEDRWSEHYDVILANPPFFSPKGGIKPHSRFGVQSSKAEVLFVDYIMEHLRPNGRAGIIVPEGIIFQTGKAYKALRKRLVEECLVGVISLPAGVFNPYSGVKTSILILDKKHNQKSDSIFFVKVENDGFSLGAQRIHVKGSQLPLILEKIRCWDEGVHDDIKTITKFQILETIDCSLSSNKYLNKEVIMSEFPIVIVGDVCQIQTGRKNVNTGNPKGNYPFFTCARENTFSDEYSFDTEALLIAGNGEVGRVVYYKGKFEAYQRTYILDQFDKILPRFLYFILQSRLPVELDKLKQGNTMPYIKVGMLKEFKIPLPPIEIQKQIVDELDGYQKFIDGCRQAVENYKPTIDIDPSWEIVKLKNIIEILDSKRKPLKKTERVEGEYPYYGATGIIDYVNDYIFDEQLVLIGEDGAKWKAGDESAFIAKGKYWVNNHAHVVRPLRDKVLDFYLVQVLNHMDLLPFINGVTVPKLNQASLRSIEIPLPPIKVQQQIVDELDGYQKVIDAARELAEIHTQKIHDRIGKVWGE